VHSAAPVRNCFCWRCELVEGKPIVNGHFGDKHGWVKDLRKATRFRRLVFFLCGLPHLTRRVRIQGGDSKANNQLAARAVQMSRDFIRGPFLNLWRNQKRAFAFAFGFKILARPFTPIAPRAFHAMEAPAAFVSSFRDLAAALAPHAVRRVAGRWRACSKHGLSFVTFDDH
jgi:hypothetical protein